MPSSLQSPIENAVNEVNLPLIDISEFPLEFGDRLQYNPEVTKLRDAYREWGFFRHVNHGIPVDLLQKFQTVAKGLFSMPTEAKDRTTNSYPFESYFGLLFRLPMKPSASLTCPIQIQSKKSPQGYGANKETQSSVIRFGNTAIELASKIMKLILASHDLDVEKFYKSDFENCEAYLRINGYSSNGKSIGEKALLSHADRSCLTIMLGDEKEGLEIRSKEGKWLTVKPVSNTLVVNVGDSLKFMPN
ncbi:hypothetical protein KI387_005363 [Taxus chinensis]|uniref:Uncharacterized protein n=1 Tax=Taxus chinensis TaxID=29808 RepID=A0AA38GR14_TAXCH|nr:hypothetical protein KI387_005363 [Taxus chinensis]